MSVKKLDAQSEYPARVEKCSARNCAFNGGNQCRARAITIGEGVMTKCDTFLPSFHRVDEKTQVAQVGACKVSTCAHNEDLECRAKQVRIGNLNGEPGCMDFVARFPW
ncbi:MAG: DUF1540 domain-containing protein [Bdellovibrionia bacterium]